MSSSRRYFAKTIAAATAVVTVDVIAQTPQPPPSPLATALTNLVRAEHGKHLSDDDMKRIAKDFQDYMPYLERFREFKLLNSDEPDFVFSSMTLRES